ncbi:MAG: GNAT family N-acetyltransferase, partial [Clostridia bacterium]|nr:GNAT family N-acetyltransferase [Clostridia bacterium]
HGLAARRYPAHLHIDILKGYRGGGNGTRMVETLCGHLKAQGVKGVHLIVGEENPNAIRFYERCGFDTQVKFTIGRIMGRKL